MAARYQATYSSTPASVIYSQSWPIPSSHSLGQRYPGKAASNNHRKSLNSPWICKAKKHDKTPLQDTSPVDKSHRWASSMLSNHYPEWIEEDAHVKLDMAKEFRLTLQMFKKLTQQVKEVDEQLNSTKKPYSFKHYYTSKDSPGIHRSQLSTTMRSYTPEVPMTNQAYQPCNNFGLKREQQRPHTHLGVYRTSDKAVNNIPKSKADTWSSSHSVPTFNNKSNISEQEKSVKTQRHQLTLKEYLKERNKSNNDFTWSSSPELNEDGNIGFGYIDPVPDDWEKIKLEELEQEFTSDDKNKTDPFIVRYLELRRLEAETLENERRNPKTEDTIENVSGLHCGSVKTMGTGNIQGKKCSNKKYSSKTSEEKIKAETFSEKNLRSSEKSSRKSSHSLHSLSGSVFKPALDVNKYSKSCVSKYVEGKLGKNEAGSKEKKQANTASCGTKKTKCSSARARRKVCNSNGKVVHSTNSYQSCFVAQYDIVELASSFDLPCKDRIKSKSRPVTAKSAKSKGLLPGKSWSSQRRFSLTSDQALGQMTDTELPSNKPSSKSRQKSAKRNTKRCASSQQ